MSSHHIVREAQEPALLLHQLPEGFSPLHSLLEWSPTVVCCEPSIERYLKLGHKLDVALVGLETLDFWKETLREQAPVKILAITPESFLETGLHLLYRERHQAVNIVTCSEAFQEMRQTLTDWCHLTEVIVFSESHRVIVQHRPVFKKWLPAGSQLELTPMEEDQRFTTHGLVDNLKEEMIMGTRLLTVSETGIIKLEVASGTYLISEPLGG